MKTLFTILFSLFILTACVHSQWVWQNPLPQGNGATDIKMFNSGTGYHRTYCSILKTTNFGADWEFILNNDSVGDIFFVNEQTGYHAKGTYLYKTVNGGTSWNLITTFQGGEMTWLNESTGFVLYRSSVNSNPYYGTKISKTTNGGSNWQEVFSDTTLSINSLSFPTNNTGYAAGITKNVTQRNAKFFRSVNAGLTWDSIPILNLRNLTSVNFINNNTGFLSGTRLFPNGPNLLKTTNGGASWDSVNFQIMTISNLYFINELTGYSGTGLLRKTINGGVNWNSLNISGPNAGSFSIYNGDHIYVVGNKGETGRSTDNGINWTVDSKGYRGLIYSMKFFDANTGIATGENSGMLLRTTNSGQSWDTTNYGGLLLRIHLYDENTAYIGGQGKVLKTTNKGASFTAYNTFSAYYWEDVSFPNENTGYTIYKYRVMDKTTNGGVTWTNVLPWGGGKYFTVCFINANTGFYGGSNIMKTTNGGTTWDTVRTGLKNKSFCDKIRYYNNKLYIIGYCYSPSVGYFGVSTDEGNSWQMDTIPQSSYLYDISVPEPGLIYIIGQGSNLFKNINNTGWTRHNMFTATGYSSSVHFINKDTGFVATYDGGILKTTNGGGTPIGINIGSNEIPKNFNLYQNYPNPFNPTTIIEYSLPKSSLVTIKVYDILGRFVTELVNHQQNAGHHSIPFDGSRYASGIYFYTIETPGFIQSKKMVLIK